MRRCRSPRRARSQTRANRRFRVDDDAESPDRALASDFVAATTPTVVVFAVAKRGPNSLAAMTTAIVVVAAAELRWRQTPSRTTLTLTAPRRLRRRRPAPVSKARQSCGSRSSSARASRRWSNRGSNAQESMSVIPLAAIRKPRSGARQHALSAEWNRTLTRKSPGQRGVRFLWS